MKNFLRISFCLIAAVSVLQMLNSTFLSAAEKNAPVNVWKLWYKQPAANWNEALPIGNGRLGAMAFGYPDSERIQLNEDTLWDGRPADTNNPEALKVLPEVRRLLFEGKNDEATKLAGQKMMGIPFRVKSYQSLGDLRITYADKSPAADYRRELDLDTGIVKTSYTQNGINYTSEVFSSHPDQVIVYRMVSDKPGKISCKIAMTRQQDSETKSSSDGSITLSGKVGGKWVGFEAKAIVSAKDGSIASDGINLNVENASEMTIVLAGATSYKNNKDYSGDPSALCENYLNKIKGKSFDKIRAAHIADHRSFFRRIDIDLGHSELENLPTDKRLEKVKEGADDPQLAALYFQYGRYLLIGCSRPGEMPANLQGLWNEHMKAPWNSDYHTNINLQMNYWPAGVANLAEFQLPLFDYMESLMEPGHETAKVHYGADGWVVHHLSDIWGFTTPADGVWGVWPMGAAWLARHPWEHYLFTSDRQFLEKRGYPMMKGAARFMLDFLVTAPEGTTVAGKLVTNPSHSPENTFIKPDGTKSQFTYGATMDLMIAHDLFTNCIEAIDVLGEDYDPKFRAELENALAKLAPIQISKKTGGIQEWIEDYDEAEPGHRHMSHLYGFHPGNQITPTGTPELAKAVRNSLDRRLANGGGGTGWSRAWVINFFARFSDGENAYKNLKYLFSKCTLPNMFDTHPPFQIDGNFAGTAGIAEMLLQSHELCPGEKGVRIVNLLPALPTQWGNGYVKGIRARGGFTVDMTWEGSKLKEGTIVSSVGGKCAIKSGVPLIVSSGGKKLNTFFISDGILIFNTRPGKVYIVSTVK